MAEDTFTWGSGGEKLTPAERRRRIAAAMIKTGMDFSPVQHWTQGAARVAQALLGQWDMNKADAEEKAGRDAISGDAAAMTGGAAAAPSMAGGSASRSMAMPSGITPEIKTGIAEAASALGISPVDLATTISYETGGTFDPTKAGPTTKWGQHRGLIQFGEPQAKQYGVDWSNPVGSQLGANGAVVAYLRDRGVKPGMGLMDIYSTINAGAPGLYNRSDAAAGGAPGTVADKVNTQMAGHRAKAQAMFGAADLPAPGARQGFLGERGALPNFDPATGRWLGPSNPPALAAAPQPGVEAPVVADPAPQPQEQPLAPVFTAEGASQPWMGSAIMPAPPQPQIAQAQPQAVPLPPPRPADLAMPQADLPAPGAVQAMGQLPIAAPAPIIADPTKDNAGVLSGLVASEEARKGLPSAASSPSIMDRIASAIGGGSSQVAPPPAPSAGVQRVAAVAPAAPASEAPAAPSAGVDRVAAAMRVLNSPYAQPGQRAVAQAIVERSLAPKNVQTVDLGNSIGVLDAQGNITRQIPKTAAPSKPTYGKIGVDGNGDDVFGFIDPEKQTVTPSTAGKAPQVGQPAPGVDGQAPAIPPAPPGVNGKIWREEQSKRAVENNLPASFDDTTKARNELAQRPAYKNMAQAAPIYKSMVEAAGRDTKAADLNMVYGLGKIMDPGSVVREGEIQMANDTQGLADRLNGFIKAIQGEGRLRPEARAMIMQEAYGRLQSYEALYNQDADFYRGIAKNRRMNPDEVVPSFGTFEPWALPAPAAGAAKPGAPAAAPAAPKSKADFDALPSGSHFTAPDGTVRIKP